MCSSDLKPSLERRAKLKSLLREFQVNPNDIEYLGKNLQRPECILAQRDGTLWSADARGGVVRLGPDGSGK